MSCTEYDVIKIKEALEETFRDNPEWLEGFTAGESVFLKLNLLLKKKPQEAVTTHPAIVEAVVRFFQDRQLKVIIGDSPGGPYLPSRLKNIYRVCGIEDVAERTGAELNYDVTETVVTFSSGKVVRSFPIITPVVKADKVVSLPKLKTHMMMKYTGAVKNLFGTIPGLKKADYHLKMPEVTNFADMLIDLALCVKPSLHIMDAIVGMEGAGPSNGISRQVGALLISDDPFALDVVATSLVGIRPESVPTITQAQKRGLMTNINDLEIRGESLNGWKLKPFKTPQIKEKVNFPIPEYISRILRPKPIFKKDKCIGCGECIANCPPKALSWDKGVPVVDLDACIRCFCCQELCPQGAIKVKRNILGKFLEM